MTLFSPDLFTLWLEYLLFCTFVDKYPFSDVECLLFCTFVDKCPFSESKSGVNDLRDLDAIRDWTREVAKNEIRKEEVLLKYLIVVYSYHHNNTQKVAQVMAKVLDAKVKSPQQTNPEELNQYDIVGFGAGIDSGKHYKELLDFADNLPQVTNKKAFVFSTSGTPIGISGQQRLEAYTRKCHTTLKETLQSKGYTIIDEFGCAGFNTNKFLKWFGGINKGRPNEEDLKNAEAFAEKLKV